MKTRLLIPMLMLLAACTDEVRREQWLSIDFNGTIKHDVYLYNANNEPIDTASADKYIYRFNIAELPYGVYSIVTPDSAAIPIAKDDDGNITICARLNHFDDATTDNAAVANLWEINRVCAQYDAAIDAILTHNAPTVANRRVVAAQINAVVKHWKPIVKQLVEKNSKSLCVLPLLKFGEKSSPLFNIIDDYDMYKSVADNADGKFANNEDIMRLRALLADNAELVSFVRHSKIGDALPDVGIRTKDGITVNARELGKPAIIICSTDSSVNAINIWNSVSAKRYAGFTIMADVPASVSGNIAYNITKGQLVGKDAVMLRKLQPIVIAADADGKITHIAPFATYDDDALIW